MLPLVTRSSDGQMLFLANMASKMNHSSPLGSRIAQVHNGSSLFTGDAGSGESNIRRWLFENDWVEAIVALPLNLFYNTGIATYVWLLSNPDLAANLKAPETADREACSLVLVAESKETGEARGTVRIETNVKRPLAIQTVLPEKSVYSGRTIAYGSPLPQSWLLRCLSLRAPRHHRQFGNYSCTGSFPRIGTS